MERMYADIAASIGDLARQGLVRVVNVINDYIIGVIKVQHDLERTHADRRLVDTYSQKIKYLW